MKGDPKVIVAFVSKYNFWNDVNVVPVVDVGESVPMTAVCARGSSERRSTSGMWTVGQLSWPSQTVPSGRTRHTAPSSSATSSW